MSTKAIITIEGLKHFNLYKHWDGGPYATLPWLETFNKKFEAKRGDDNEYKAAQLIRSSILYAEEFSLDKSTEEGWGIYPDGGICANFRYRLMKDGSVTYQEL